MHGFILGINVVMRYVLKVKFFLLKQKPWHLLFGFFLAHNFQ